MHSEILISICVTMLKVGNAEISLEHKDDHVE